MPSVKSLAIGFELVRWTALPRVPETSGSKLVYAPSADPEKPLICCAWYEAEGTENEPGWSLLPAHWLAAITHWMELPAPPKESVRA